MAVPTMPRSVNVYEIYHTHLMKASFGLNRWSIGAISIGMATSLSQRLANARHKQARALAGVRGPLPVSESANDDATASCAPVGGLQSRESLLREFDNLLPGMTAYYGYSDEDVRQVRDSVTRESAAGRHELELCVHQWRIDVAVHQVGGLAEEVAERAWIQFRQSVMGARAGEDGRPYADDALECPPPRQPAPIRPPL